MKGLLVLEGLDGSGKSTQFDRLLQRLHLEGHTSKGISFPDYEEESSSLVRMYLNGEFGADADSVNAYAASSFYAVDRYASYKNHWQADYEAGTLIVAARYVTSNAIYQMAKLQKERWEEYLSWLFDYEYNRLQLPKPDCVLFLDMPPQVSQRLLSKRYGGDESRRDLHERDEAYLLRCREAALFAADLLGWAVIPCARQGQPLPVETIHEAIYQVFRDQFELRESN